MSAARKLTEPGAGEQAVVVRLVPKMVAIEAALKACERGDCQPQDVAVAAYIVSSIDRATGECTQHYETIAKGCGMSRRTAARSIERLVDAGVIERAPRFARNRAQIATAFKIGANISATIAQRTAGTPRVTSGTPPCHQWHTKVSSRDLLYPAGGPANRKRDGPKQIRDGTVPSSKKAAAANLDDADWEAHAIWLAEAGQYAKRWGYGAEAGAADDIERWRREKGDDRLLQAIDGARSRGLYGEVLSNWLENTRPGRGAA